MEQLSEQETRTIVLNAASLNATGRHKEAIDLIKKDIGRFDDDLRFNGLMEVLNSAVALNDVELAKTMAKEIAKEHPDLPSIQPYL